jgi:HSF-type DNA-binding
MNIAPTNVEAAAAVAVAAGAPYSTSEEGKRDVFATNTPRDALVAPNNAQNDSLSMGGRPRSVQFPWKLHRLLEYCHDQVLEDVMSWDTAGKTFQIHSKARFEAEIMPRFFDTNKFKSFQRSLNLWGFYIRNRGNKGGPNGATDEDEEINEEEEQEQGAASMSTQPNQEQGGECYHPLFVRGRPDLCHQMLRIKKRTTKTRKSPRSSPKKSVSVSRGENDSNKNQPPDLNNEVIRKILMGATSTSTEVTSCPTFPSVTASLSPFAGPVGGSGNTLLPMLPRVLPESSTRMTPLAMLASLNSTTRLPSSLSSVGLTDYHSPALLQQALCKMLLQNGHASHQAMPQPSAWLAKVLAGSGAAASMMDASRPIADEVNARMLLELASPPCIGSSRPSPSMVGSMPSSALAGNIPASSFIWKPTLQGLPHSLLMERSQGNHHHHQQQQLQQPPQQQYLLMELLVQQMSRS